MAHHHHHVKGKNLFITIILNIIITLSQIVGGIYANSLSLLSDAMHNLSDVLSLVIAWAANTIAAKPSTKSYTFGLKRAEIIAALFNASLLLGIAIFLVIEAFHKFFHPQSVDSLWVIWLGGLSILLNTLSVLLVKKDSEKNINIKAAYLHLLTDVFTSIAVVVGGLLMQFYHIYWVDPAVSLLIAFYLIYASIDIVKESIAILMEFAPKSIDIEKIADEVKKIEKVENIHHIHIWRLGEHDIFLEAHIDFKENLPLQEVTQIIADIEKLLREKFYISHVTLQPEFQRDDDKSIVVQRDPGA
ncbi:cation diffusion facilitator family transporter [Nitratiruptor sp. SB155-2]|uniref:cation diffusion facilitator family transporter n=1 Tax=Nitratiruptor sp. (strain SB155-2) TaxID=387092 RepID=UPI0001586EA1|nr:cation diffusion facilitator family transporter [Nitratiruptor sp. SB155-2]BAF69195.1 cation efflux system protein, CDF family [Nitratiruptor sp. SB155-2]